MTINLVTLPSIMLVDDNALLLETLVEMLDPMYRVVAALHEGGLVVEKVTALCPDLIILDISLGDPTGLEVARRLRAAGLPPKIIFLTVHEDIDFINTAFDIGASGYVFKSRVIEDLTKAIDIVFTGGRFSSVISPSALKRGNDVC